MQGPTPRRQARHLLETRDGNPDALIFLFHAKGPPHWNRRNRSRLGQRRLPPPPLKTETLQRFARFVGDWLQ